jgi:hypothetical protein
VAGLARLPSTQSRRSSIAAILLVATLTESDVAYRPGGGPARVVGQPRR